MLPDASILWMNSGAQRLIARCPAIAVVDESLRLADGRDDFQFLRFLEQLGWKQASLAIKFEGEASFCVFRGWRMPSTDRCCIEIRFSNMIHAPDLGDFAKVFGLTAKRSVGDRVMGRPPAHRARPISCPRARC